MKIEVHVLTEYYKAAREEAALVQKDWLGIVKLTGSERVTWLQGMVTNDVAALVLGQSCYAAHLNPQGKMIAHFTILAEADALWLMMERSVIGGLVTAFDKLLIMEDVQVSDVSMDFEVLGLMGPSSKGLLNSWLSQPSAQKTLWVATELGCDVWAPREQADRIIRELTVIGTTAVDRGTWDVIRTEAGLPIFGVDIDESTVMPELGDHGISYSKGCYVGQEVVAKVKYIGHVNRRFCGLIVNDADIAALPEAKSVIRRKDKDVGYITTSLFSPGLNAPIALGFVNRSAAAAGTIVDIISAGKTIAATVTDLPFQIPA